MTALFLQNTRTRSKERFTPIDPQNVRVYVCGPTVYERAHLGNARSAVAFDVLYRLLQQLYPQVTFVRNITDVDDKINAAALAQNRPISEITTETTRWFQDDMRALQVLSPDHEPRATDYIPHMIKMIQTLIAKGHAYEAEGHVLFRVSSFAEYGRFSGSSPDAILAGARVEVAPYKQDPCDFVLWKPSDTHLPGWDSPWGRGRPGWHIECSAMSLDLLGFPFDIHTGGQDLIFPHHENEIAQGTCAQSIDDDTCAQDQLVAHYWLHNGFLKVEGEKMSKSRGNYLFVHDLLQKYPGEVIRLALISTHYRQALDWTQTSPQQAQQTLDRFYTALQAGLDAGLPSRVLDPMTPPHSAAPELLEALCDDMNTPKALAIPHDQASTVLRAATKGGPSGRADARYAADQLLHGGRLLGLLQHTPEAWFQQTTPGQDSERLDLSADAIEALLQERRDARSAGDYARADAIRDQLTELGISIEDGQGQTRWKRIRV